MAQAIQRIKLLPIDTCKPYYTVQSRENHMLKAKQQVLQIIAGTAWVSNNGQDYVLKAGDAITLMCGGDNVVVVSGMRGQAVEYTLSE